MNTTTPNTNHRYSNECRYALRRGVDYWALAFEGRETVFKHELGALYVAYLLLNPPPEPLHAVAVALKAREMAGKAAGPEEVIEEGSMELEEAAKVRELWHRQLTLERLLEDKHEIEPVKAEALRELEELTECLRQSPWLSHHGAERCADAVAEAVRRFHGHLAAAADTEGKPHLLLRAFAQHLRGHLLIPTRRYAESHRSRGGSIAAGCFVYLPPAGVVWNECGVRNAECGIQSPAGGVQSREPAKSKVSGLESKVQRLGAGVQGPRSKVQSPADRRPAAVERLASFISFSLALVLLATGCAGPRPLKGGKAVTTHKLAGVIEQTLVQSENPSQASKQTQESHKVRTYTVPAGSRVEQSPMWGGECPREPRLMKNAAEVRAREDARPPGHQPSTLNSLPRQSQATAGQPPQPSSSARRCR